MQLESIDLDNFPTNTIAQRMLSRVSPIYENSYVMKWMYQVMGIELEEMRHYIQTFLLQRFPETATWGIKYLEQKYDVKTDDSLELQERRNKVIGARPYRGSVTPYYIEQVADRACGVETLVEEHNSEYYFNIYADDTGTTADLKNLIAAVDRVKPSHLCYCTNVSGELPHINIYVGIAIAETYSCTVIEAYNENEI